MTGAPSPAPTLDQLVTFSHTLADVSAAAIRPHFRQILTVSEKMPGVRFDPVTEADRAAETAIRARIHATYPDHAVLGEEHGSAAGNAPYRWVIDPIDGTRAFILGLPTWGTLIGLEFGGTPTIGLMNQPFTGDRFWCNGATAFHRDRDGATRTLQTRTGVALAAAQMAATHPDMFADGAERAVYEQVAGSVRACRLGTDCFGYALLAAGLVDLVVEAGLQPYDIVALIPIIEQAGGVVTTWEGGPARHGGRIIAAASPALHAEALALIRQTMR